MLGVIFAITFVSLFTYIPVYSNTLEQKTQQIKQDAEFQAVLLRQIFKPVINEKNDFKKRQYTEESLKEIRSLWFELNLNNPDLEYFLVHKDVTTDKLELVLSSKGGEPSPRELRIIQPTIYMALGGQYGTQSITDISNTIVLTAYAPIIPKEWGVVIKYEQLSISPSLIETFSYTLFATLLITAILWLVLSVTIRHLNSRISTSEDRFEQILETSGDWVWEIDRLGALSYSTKQVHNMLGYYPEEILSKPISSLFDTQESQTSALIWQQKIMLNESFSNLEIGFVNKAKQHVYILMSAQPIFNKQKKRIGYRGIAKNITAIKEHEDKVLNMAYFDSLTGLANRTHFMDQLKRHIASQTASALRPSALLFIDLNGFKSVNDIDGHETGDKLLKIIAKRMQNQARKKDIIARFGGDEFVILIRQEDKILPSEFNKTIEHRLKSLLETISEPIHINNKQIQISAAIGVATIPKDGKNISDIINHADSAMYKAKSHGKGCYHFYDDATQTAIDNVLKSSAELKEAIAKKQFEVYYQLQFETLSNEVIGMEAFLRWHHPETHQILPASDFLKHAYHTNNINDIDEWVIKAVAKDLYKLNKHGIKSLPISINLSTQKLEQTSLVSVFEDAIKRNFISPSSLTVEITERTLLHDLDKSTQAIEKLRQLGVKVCIDNFGTGYSSLSYIQALPIESIKIDKSFIEHIAISHSDLQICKTFIQLGKSLDLKVIAEGVQTELQRDILKQEGCHIMQGYLFSKPQPIEKVISQLLANVKTIKI